MIELYVSLTHSLLSSAQISKAVMLQKGAEYITQLKSERQQLTEEAEMLKAQIESLSCEIR